MAIAFTYTEATNIVVVTGGTSGTPATFADFVTAGRAGTATLLVATAGLSPTLALTYQIRPVEDMALLITFTVAGKTTQADYIFITGTDWRDAAQTESIDVSAGNGVYVSTKYFRTITNIDCSDGAGGGGTAWADGTVAVTQPQWGVIWDYGLGQYEIDSNFLMGDGSTPTYFTSKNESAIFSDNIDHVIKAAATLQMGDYQNGWVQDGSYWSSDVDSAGKWIIETGVAGTLKMYGSHLNSRSSNNQILIFGGGDIAIYGSTISSESTVSRFFGASINSLYLDGITFSGGDNGIDLRITPDSMKGITIHDASGNGLYVQATEGVVAGGVKFTAGLVGNAVTLWASSTTTLSILDPIDFPASPAIFIGSTAAATSWVKEQYTCNIHVVDKDGTAIQNVIVDCVGSDSGTASTEYDTAQWTAGTIVTDASGDITEQTITAKKWATSSETLTNYNYFKFTLSKAGYETLVLDNITVDSPIVWHLELQPAGGAGAQVKHIGIGVNI